MHSLSKYKKYFSLNYKNLGWKGLRVLFRLRGAPTIILLDCRSATVTTLFQIFSLQKLSLQHKINFPDLLHLPSNCVFNIHFRRNALIGVIQRANIIILDQTKMFSFKTYIWGAINVYHPKFLIKRQRSLIMLIMVVTMIMAPV